MVRRRAVAEALPAPFLARMRRLLGSEAGPFERALAEPPTVGLRVNTAKLSAAAFARLSGWPLEPVPWCPAGFTLPDGAAERLRPGAHPWHRAGLYYLQDPSAMAVAEAAAPRAADLTIDLAAAPGGKATHLAALLAGVGALVANDIHRKRVEALGHNLERWGAANVAVTQTPIARLARGLGARFDLALLDAPCSGEGMFRKSADALRDWSDGAVARCALRQRDLLDEAARLIRPGGGLLYSTCTFAPEENEVVVAAFLDRHPGFALETIALPGTAPGRADWAPSDHPLERTARLWPHRAVGEGHFLALLRRSDDAVPETRGRPRPRRPEGSAPPAAPTARHKALWNAFATEALALLPDTVGGAELQTRGDRLLARSPLLPSLAGLGALRDGLWLGRFRKDRFVPDHALALALPQGAFAHTLDLAPDDPRLTRYLEGHPLEAPGPDGWLAIAVSGHALGWGRRARGAINNAYPKGLRLR